MNIRILIVALVFSTAAAGQRPKFEFGDISLEDFQMTAYPADTAAEAVLLFDYGEYSIRTSHYYRHTLIKILKPSGYRYADFIVPAPQGAKVFPFKAATYNFVNGKIETTTVTQESRFKDEFNEDIEVIKWAHPNVKVGSIIEVQYEIAPYGIPQWRFQHDIPCRHSEFNILTISEVKLNIQIQGYFVPALVSPNHWVLKDVPALKEEPLMLPSINYVSMANVDVAWVSGRLYSIYGGSQLYTRNYAATWDELANDYRNMLSTLSQGTGYLRTLALQLISDRQHPDLNLLNLYKYVKENIRWNKFFAPIASKKMIKTAFDKQLGSSAEINLLLICMMRHVGLPADPVLISTRSNGFVRKEVPNFRKFNHVLIQTDFQGKRRLIDASDPNLSLDFVQKECLNGSGYWVKEEGFAWLDIANADRTRSVAQFALMIDENQALRGSYSVEKTGYAAGALRDVIRTQTPQKYADSLFTPLQGFVDSVHISGLDFQEPKTKETYQFVLKDYVQKQGYLIYVNPNLFRHFTSNPLPAEGREYPIDFGYPFESITTIRIPVPEGYAVDELPTARSAILPDNAGRFTYNVSQLNNEVIVVSQFIIVKPGFPQTDLPLLRQFIGIILAKEAEMLVFRKK